jgi:hypothetical protein
VENLDSVGYTESMAFYTSQRIRSLGLDGVLDYLYCPRDHAVPRGLSRKQVRQYPDEHYELKHTLLKWTPKGVLKPNKQVLLNIIREVGADSSSSSQGSPGVETHRCHLKGKPVPAIRSGDPQCSQD